ncbi:MAG TPA: Bax inhibitor-1 family protein [Candidatus Peribacterales bacterium]|nr:Bax inhibitor-1 family protein [Candidatus Peribacterales bacterium]
MQYSIPQSRPITLTKTGEMQVYALFALAMALTALGVFVGALYAPTLFRGGMGMILVIAEFGIILTSRLWMEKSPLNILLFGAFPLLSGITVSPYLWAVSAGYANGNIILVNALAATTFMAAAAALFARTTSMDLGILGRSLFFAVLGLIGFTLLQIFVPSLRQSIGFEMGLSGAGIVIFALFTAYDVQRVQTMSRLGANPFLLALSLYLDIFNLFLYIVRFMLAVAGDRR